jgi:hypothetical protein
VVFYLRGFELDNAIADILEVGHHSTAVILAGADITSTSPSPVAEISLAENQAVAVV